MCPMCLTFPIPTILHKIPSEFADVVLLIDTKTIPEELRRYLMLYIELMFESPANVNGKELTFEEVSKLNTKDLLSNSISVGINNSYDQLLFFRLRVDAPNYGNLAKWAQIYLKNIIFDPNRVAICAKMLYNAAAQSKRDGNSVAAFLSRNSVYKKRLEQCDL